MSQEEYSRIIENMRRWYETHEWVEDFDTHGDIVAVCALCHTAPDLNGNCDCDDEE